MAGIGTRKSIRIVDETPVYVNGEPTPRSIVIYNGWADVRLRNSNRVVQNDQTQIGKFFEIRFRYRHDLSIHANIKVVYNGNRLTVQSMEREKEKKFYWIITAQAKSFS